jgi:hypothetical protein
MTALIWIELVLSLGAPEIFDPIAMPLLGTGLAKGAAGHQRPHDARGRADPQ